MVKMGHQRCFAIVTRTSAYRLVATKERTFQIGSDGRVEDGRGSLGPMASAPFPIPAHRTGRADLRHPALRLASPLGTRRGIEGQAFEAQQTAFSVDYLTGEPASAAPCHFMPSGEEIAHAL